MRFIELSPEEQSRLKQMRKTDSRYRVRDRVHALLLSDQGKSIETLAEIFEVDRDTVSSWFNRWEAERFEGLLDAPHPGRPPKLSSAEKKSS